jgi:GDP-L-fucose synthase
MYAGDFADVVVHAIKAFDTLPVLMNVGLGYDYTINEYYQAAAEVIGYSGSFVHDLGKPVGMARKLVNVERQQAWGWSAQHDLREGIEKIFSYYLHVVMNGALRD